MAGKSLAKYRGAAGGALLPAVGWSLAAWDGPHLGGAAGFADAGRARHAVASPATARSARVRPRCTLGWWAIWDSASRDVAPLDSCGSLTGAGSSVGTSVRLKSGRS